MQIIYKIYLKLLVILGIRKYTLANVVPSPEDPRDFLTSVSHLVTDSLPLRVDLRKFARDIEDQSSTGSCTANATVSALEWMLEKSGRFQHLSRLFIYWNEREGYQNLRGKDVGAYLSDGFKSVSNLGVPSEADWPFSVAAVNTKPPQDVYDKALPHKVTRYERVGVFTPQLAKQGQQLIKATLAMGYPVTIGMFVHPDIFFLHGSLNSPTCKYNTIVSSSQEYAGGHAMCLLGYDEELGGFIVENSWGTGWGDQGYGILGYEALEQQLFEAWTCKAFDGIEYSPDWQFDPIVDPMTLVTTTDTPLLYKKSTEDIFINTGDIIANITNGTAPFTFRWVSSDPGVVFVSPYQTTKASIFISNWQPNEVRSITITCQITDSSIPNPQVLASSVRIKVHNSTEIALDSNYAKIFRLYKSAFARIPDKEGIRFWVDKLNSGISLEYIAACFIDSNEFKNMYSMATNNVDYITLIYRNVLNREPDIEGLNWWVSRLVEGVSKEHILIGFSESKENMATEVWQI